MTQRSEVRQQFLDDLLTTAVEGGINYWAHVSQYRWDREQHAPEEIGVTVKNRELDAPKRVTPDDLAHALYLVREGRVGGLPQRLLDTIENIDRTNNGETGELRYADMDADIADVIFQIAVFGEVIFG